ncbi:Cof-type HAD-IIB family hydrolase [Buttiauxella sp. S04-F03]|uniref:Cof-type HAD-IIB family hydrolase n=1 Tax=Buttiauxella sp. W03-F01 TaxID=2904524 RepID=UPI001E38728D|nr:Cof-type HAD-IIB family hydrolase [Buttiauxella sp. W03-F01]MCE0799463.1 Cof-type HAD-IIB family hydrolase [Buttiauxella sp. W03-F01]
MAIDIDGTLLNDNQQISPSNIESITQLLLSGVYIVLCSGRATGGMEHIARELDLYSYENALLASFNGTCITHAKSNTELFSWELSPQDVQVINQLSIDFDIPVIFNTRAHHIINYRYCDHEFIKKKIKNRADIQYVPDGDINRLDRVLKASLVVESTKLEKYLLELHFSGIVRDFHSTRSEPWLLEISVLNSGKGAALHYLSNALNIKNSEIASIGNQENDIPMLTHADFSFAVGNATDAVKSHARYITSTNNQSGVSEAIRILSNLSLLAF